MLYDLYCTVQLKNMISVYVVYLTHFKNGFASELSSMYELAYYSWFIVFTTAAAKGVTEQLQVHRFTCRKIGNEKYHLSPPFT